MAEGAETSRRIYDQREENMVSPKDGKQTRRVARFLRPCATNSTKAVAPPPTTPLLSEIFPHNLQQWPSKVFFKGWKKPQTKWDEWVDRLAGEYCYIWNQSGICDAILSSRYEIMSTNKNIVLGLVEFWSSETNTFVFPWGEATVTLEDVMILGGFSVLGRPATRPVQNGVLVEIVEEMEKKRIEFSRTPAKKAYHSNWIKHFMELPDGYKYEHVAFLSLWLARFVFPSLPEESIGAHVFPIAAHLSQGTRLALAPAVLSGLYKDLTLLKKQALSCMEEISVPGPFQLLQLWAMERFEILLLSPPNALKPGEPRAARWHKVNSAAISLPLVRTALQSSKHFQWRPYAAGGLKNWRHSSYYRESKLLYIDSAKHSDETLQAYVRCLCDSELIGVGHCEEKYLPYRVAMQFGMDQDLPGEFSGSYFASDCNVRFLVPPWSFKPSVSSRYLHWWKKSKSARADAIKKDVASQKIKKKYNAFIAERNLHMQKASAQSLNKSKPEKKLSNIVPKVPIKSSSSPKRQTSAIPQFPKQVKKESPPDHSDDDDDDFIPISQRLRRFENRPACLHTVSPDDGYIPISLQSPNFVSSTSNIRDENVKKRKLDTSTSGFPAKKRNTGDFAKNLMKNAQKGRKGSESSDREKVQGYVPVRMGHDHKKGAKVSEKVAVREGKKAMAEGSLKNSMGVDDHKRKQSEKGVPKEVKKTMPQGLLMRVANLEKVLGIFNPEWMV